MNSDLTIYRRHFPHWRLEGSVYFVTWSLSNSQHELTPEERDLIQTALFRFDGVRYRLNAYVVMNDHVHILVLPHEAWPLERLVQRWKTYTSGEMRKRFGRILPIWKREYMDRIVRDEAEYLKFANYILTNPVRRWPEAGEYKWVGLGKE